MATVDLWPDEISSDIGLEGPTVILKEQANLLGEKTKNLVEAEVHSMPDPVNPEFFRDLFTIISTTINYRFILLRVVYPLEFFPAFVVWDGFSDYHTKVETIPARQVDSREELENELRQIFSDLKTIRIIQALVSRSRS